MPLMTVPSRPEAVPSDWSSKAAKLSLPAMGLFWVATAIRSPTCPLSSRHQRSRSTLTVACVTIFHVLQDMLVYSVAAAFLQLLEAAAGARLEAGGDEELGLGIGADHRADIAAIEHGAGRAGRPPREIA